MAVETSDFRVVGVDMDTGEDVSVVIAAATKAAAEVKAEKLNIDTTHIVRMKRHDDPPADEHTAFVQDAAEARSTTPTDKLIEEIVPPESPRETPTAAVPASAPSAIEPEVLAAVSRPAYNAPSVKVSRRGPTGTSALLFILAVLLGIAGGGYYVLVQEPQAANADDLLPPEELFSHPHPPSDSHAQDGPRLNRPNAFGQNNGRASNTPITNQPADASPATERQRPAQRAATLELQSVVVSHEGRFAVINGKLYPQGDEVAGCTIVNVADDWVLLQRGEEQFVLKIEMNEPAE